MSSPHVDANKYDRNLKPKPQYNFEEHNKICHSLAIYFVLRTFMFLVKKNNPLSETIDISLNEMVFTLFGIFISVFNTYLEKNQWKFLQSVIVYANFCVCGLLAYYAIQIDHIFSYDLCKDIIPQLRASCTHHLALGKVFFYFDIVGIALSLILIFSTRKLTQALEKVSDEAKYSILDVGRQEEKITLATYV